MCNIATEADAILGVDFLRRADACVDFDKELRLEKTVKLDHDSRGVEHCDARGTAARVALTVFTRPDSRGRKDSCMIGYRKQNEELLNCTELSRPKIEIENSEPWLVKTTQNIRVPPTGQTDDSRACRATTSPGSSGPSLC